MSTIYELMYHKELNMFNCFCGYIDLFDHWNRKIRGSINVVSFPTDCKLCEKNIILFDGKLTRMAIQFVGHVTTS